MTQFKRLKLLIAIWLFVLSSMLYAIPASDGTVSFSSGWSGSGSITLSHEHFRITGSENSASMNMNFGSGVVYGTDIEDAQKNVSCVYKVLVDGTNTSSFELTGISANDYESSVGNYNVNLVGTSTTGATINADNINIGTVDSTKDNFNTADFGLSGFNGVQLTSFEIQFVNTDDSGVDSGGVCVNMDFKSFTIANAQAPSLNTAPTNTLPSAPTVQEDDTNVAFADDIAIADTDSDNQSVTLRSTNGTMSMITTGVTLTTGDATDDMVIAFNGTLANVNTALDSLTFTPTANFNGTATLQMQTDDGNSGTDADTLNIMVSAVNDTPTISSTAITSVDEDSVYSYTLIGDDVDADNLTWSVENATTLASWLSLSSSTNINTIAGTNGTSGATGDGSLASSATLNNLYKVAVDTNGNIYIADRGNHAIRKVDISTGNISTVAGTIGSDGETGDGGVATSATLDDPSGVAVDTNGNIYIADTSNHAIRKVDISTGNISTVAGTLGTSGATGDGGLATNATLNFPYDIAIDLSGNIYIADKSNHAIRKVDITTGNISTVAGTIGSDGATGDGGLATSATLKYPYGVDVDLSGNIYIADKGNDAIRKVDITTGNISTVAGTLEISGVTGDGGLATSATLNAPYGVNVDTSGNIYIADTSNNAIRKVDISTGNISTVAGTLGASGRTGDEESATSAKLNSPTGVFVDDSGSIYIADRNNQAIRKVQSVTKLSGTPTNADVGVHDVNLTLSDGINEVEHNFQISVINVNDMPTASDITLTIDEDTPKTFGNTEAIAINFQDVDGDTLDAMYITSLPAKGTLTLSDTNVVLNQRLVPLQIGLLKYIPLANESGTPYTTFNFKVSDGDLNSTEHTVTINVNNVDDMPTITSTEVTSVDEDSEYSYTLAGVDIEGDDLAWSVKSGTNLPSWLSLSSSTKINTIAGTISSAGLIGDGGLATDAKLHFPQDITLDSSGNIYIADTSNNAIRKVDISTGNISTVAGTLGTSGATGDGGLATNATLNYPMGIVLDTSGNIYIADRANNAIRKVDISTGNISTVAGTIGSSGASGDGGLATDAKLNFPQGVALDSSGNIYISDRNNNAIRKVDISTGNISTIAGTLGTSGATGDGGLATSATLDSPTGIVIDKIGDIYFSDSQNHAIRKVDISTGNISTIAGTLGTSGATGDGGVATSATLNNPDGVAVDNKGNIYIADSYNYAIRKVDENGNISTISGTLGWSGNSGDGAEAINAKLYGSSGVTLDSSGNIYIADLGNHAIRKIDTPITKLTGTPINDNVGEHNISLNLSDGTSTVEHNFTITVVNTNDPVTGLSLSSNSINENNTSGVVIGSLNSIDIDLVDTFTYTFCGGSDDANFSISANNLKASTVFDYEQKSSYSICLRTTDGGSTNFDKTFTIDITNINDNTPTVISTAKTTSTKGVEYSYTPTAKDTDNDSLTWSVKSGTTLPSWLSLQNKAIVSTFAGSGTKSSVDGIGTDASFDYPKGVAIDSSGNIYVAQTTSIRKITPSGVVSKFVENSDDSMYFTGALAIDSDDNIFFADSFHQKIFKVTQNGNITTFAGSGTKGSTNATSDLAEFNQPMGVAIDSIGNVYVTDRLNNKIRKITPSGVVSTFAGSGTQGSADGTGDIAEFDWPVGIAIDSSDNIFVTDKNKIRKITSSGVVSTFAGSATAWSTDGEGITASFNNPHFMTIDKDDNIFLADLGNNQIRKITPNASVTTVAGLHSVGDIDGEALLSKFHQPYAIALDSRRNLYVSDFSNNKIRKITFSSILSGNPECSDIGTHTISLSVSDGIQSVDQVFDINVTNDGSCTTTPTDPSEPTTPTDPSEPTTPTDPSEPTTPTEGGGTPTPTPTTPAVGDTPTDIPSTQAEQCVEDVITSITFDEIKGSNINQLFVTNDLDPISSKTSACGDITITWECSDTSVITNEGVISRGVDDQTVSLIATVSYDGANTKKGFLLTVRKATITNDDISQILTFEMIKKDNRVKSKILSDLDLINSIAGKSITWISSDTSVISADGTVTRSTGDTNITISATIEADSTKDFNLTVVALPSRDIDKVAKDKEWLTYDDILGKNKDNNNIEYKLQNPLPSSAPNGSVITWSSSIGSVISNDGNVTRSDKTDKYVIFTATFTLNDVAVTKEFRFRVLQEKPQEDVGTTFKRVIQEAKKVKVQVQDKDGNDKNTTVEFDTDLEFEETIDEESVKQTVVIGDKKIKNYLNTDGTTQTNSEFVDDNNNTIISSVESHIAGTNTKVANDGRTTSSISTQGSDINASINSDGTVEHIVMYATGKQTKAKSSIDGENSTVIASDGKVTTTARSKRVELGDFMVEAQVTTDTLGETFTQFIRINKTTGEKEMLSPTIDSKTPFESGNTVNVREESDGSDMYIDINATITKPIKFWRH